MLNEHTITVEERDAIAQMARSEGWKIVMRQFITPLVLQTNARLDAIGTADFQTQFHRGVKFALKRFIEEIYNKAQLPNPFEAHMQAFIMTLDIQQQPEKELNAEEVKIFMPRRQGLSPVL